MATLSRSLLAALFPAALFPTALVLAALVLVLLAPSSVSAQEDSNPGARAEAERLFAEANEAYEAERFPAARDLLRRSLRAHGSVSAAYNLAIVEQSMGLFVEAEATLTRLLDGDYGTLRRRERRSARALRRDVTSEQSTIMVTLRGGDGTLVIDGDTVAELQDGVEHVRMVNPGELRVTAVGERGARAGAQVSAQPGRGFEVELFLLEGRGVASAQGAPADSFEPGSTGDTEEVPRSRRGRRIGLVVGAILLAGAGAAVAAVLLRPRPYEDDVFPTALPLSLGR